MPSFNPFGAAEEAIGGAIVELIKLAAEDRRDFEEVLRDTLTKQLHAHGSFNPTRVSNIVDQLISDQEIQGWLNAEQLPQGFCFIDALARKLSLDLFVVQDFFLAFEIAVAKNDTLNKILQNRRDASRTQSLQELVKAPQEKEAAQKTRDHEIVQRYCRKLRERFSTIHLFGEKRHEASRKEGAVGHMSDIDYGFVPLHLTDWQEDGAGQETAPLEIDELFFTDERPHRFLLRGLPGSGKTTLLRYLAYHFASQCLEGRREWLPVYLQLKDLNLSKTSLEDFIHQQIDKDSESTEDCEVLCARGRFLDLPTVLLLDGLDEIADGETQKNITEKLDELARQHPRCSIIVTARSIGLQRENYPKYHPLDLRPLNKPLIDDYLAKWFEGDADKIAKLQETFENKPRIRALAANPFLLSMICFTYERGGDPALIEHRSALYENCTKYLLLRLYDPESADKSKPKPNYENTLAILKDLSLRFFLWQEPNFPVDHVNVMGQQILTAEVLGKTADFLDRVLRETGLIQRAKEGFTFVHRSLWEYFTALSLLKKPDFVIRHAANPDWEEVVRLYAGLLQKNEEVAELVAGLWNINRPLALRVTTEVQTPAAELIKPLIQKEEGNQGKLLLIDSLAQSLPLIPESERQKLVHETLSIILIDCEERDCEVIYHAQELLEKMGMQPLEPGGLIHDLFDLEHAAERQQKLLSDPANHFSWLAVAGSAFWMGDDEHQDNEKPAHRVKMDSFCMAKYPVTNRLLSNFPFGVKYPNEDDNLPATSNTWWEAYYFALWVDSRLPTEAEWEFAARGGLPAQAGKHAQRTQYYFGDSVEELSNHAWFGESEKPHAHAVDEINPRTEKENLNPLGLANMLGNVWEWCHDWYDNYRPPKDRGEVIENPRGPKTSQYRIRRGGSFYDSADALRCARRSVNQPSDRTDSLGFRLVARVAFDNLKL